MKDKHVPLHHPDGEGHIPRIACNFSENRVQPKKVNNF